MIFLIVVISQTAIARSVHRGTATRAGRHKEKRFSKHFFKGCPIIHSPYMSCAARRLVIEYKLIAGLRELLVIEPSHTPGNVVSFNIQHTAASFQYPIEQGDCLIKLENSRSIKAHGEHIRPKTIRKRESLQYGVVAIRPSAALVWAFHFIEKSFFVQLGIATALANKEVTLVYYRELFVFAGMNSDSRCADCKGLCINWFT